MRQVFRKEVKYRVHISDFLRIRDRLAAFMTPDPHGVAGTGTYTVRSLYFDSIADRDLHDNLEGVTEKRKIRIRTYDTESDFALLEYKCKSVADSRKISLVISRQEAMRLEDGDYELLLEREEELATFLYYKITKGVYRPRTIVEYERTAFLYPVSDVRITYDHNIMGSISQHGLYEPGIQMYRLIPQDYGVLEVKYNDFLVSPLQRILSVLDVMPEANSKYSSARLLTY